MAGMTKEQGDVMIAILERIAVGIRAMESPEHRQTREEQEAEDFIASIRGKTAAEVVQMNAARNRKLMRAENGRV